MTFTPGPWDCTGCLFPDDDMGGVYYRVQADGMDARAANARLISAAPELLEMLIEALPYVEMAEHDDAYKPGAVKAVAKRMRAAISKAEGQSPVQEGK